MTFALRALAVLAMLLVPSRGAASSARTLLPRMALTVSVQRGFTFVVDQRFDVDDLNAAALPTVTIAGSVGSSDLDAGSVNSTHIVPGPIAYALTTGSTNAYVAAPSPAVSALTAGAWVALKLNFTNTGAATLNVNALGAVAVKKFANQDVEAGDLRSGGIYWFHYDGTYWQVTAPSTPRKVYAVATGSTNAYAVTYSDYTTNALSDLTGRLLLFKTNAANTAACTLAVNGLAATAIKKLDGTDPASGDLPNGKVIAVVYDGTNFQLVSGTSSASLPDVVTAATKAYPASITYDAKGRITAATAGTAPASFTKLGPAAFPAAGAAATLAHSLGAVPKHVRWVAVCTTTDVGYASGDEVDVTGMYSSGGTAWMTTYADATNCVLIYASGATVQVSNKGTFAAGAVTTGNWQLYAYVSA